MHLLTFFFLEGDLERFLGDLFFSLNLKVKLFPDLDLSILLPFLPL